CMTPAQGASGRGRAPDGDSTMVTAMLAAIPFACAAFARADGTLVAANRGYRDAFGGLDGHGQRAQLLASLSASDAGRTGTQGAPLEVNAPHSNRWFALHWGTAEVAGQPLDMLTAVDISARIEALDSHKSRQ